MIDPKARELALFRHFAALEVPWVSLGEYPTPLEEFAAPGEFRDAPPLFLKREDLSSRAYGGNKVRTLEPHIGRALVFGAREFWATGAYGSNHAVASVTHARRCGLEPGIMLWPQPRTVTAQKNLAAALEPGPFVAPLVSVATLPWGMRQLPSRCRHPIYLMSPGGATLEGAMAHVSAGLELAEQVRDAKIATPSAIVLAVGSTCTSAGLLAGLHIAAAKKIAFTDRVPVVHAVRVTPWPVTSRARIAHFAWKTAQLVSHLAGQPCPLSLAALYRGLVVDPRYLGAGYGRPTRRGTRAAALMERLGGPPLDAVYSAKSAAAFFDLARRGDGPLIFWATKSSAPLAESGARRLRLAPRAWRKWLAKPPRD